jgi:hypothetical protein
MSKLVKNQSPCYHTGKKVLLVEGNTDCHVVMAMCAIHKVEINLFGIFDCGSDNQALKRLNALVNASETDQPSIIGLMLDADQQGTESRWQSIKRKLQDKPYDLPDDPFPDGTVISSTEPDYPRLGFWLMPNNKDVGMLETFINEMIPANHLESVKRSLETARQEGCTTYKDVHQDKAIVHTYLAWQDEPGRPIGQSITARVLQPETPSALAFIKWLIALFGEMS